MSLKMKQQIKKNRTGTRTAIITKRNKETKTKKAPPHANLLGTRELSSYLN